MLTKEDIKTLDWEKTGGLIPVVVQDACSGQVLMLGYMNPEALEKTLETKKVTFWSRTKQRLWTKGETSGHWLNLVDIGTDCQGSRGSAQGIDNIVMARDLELGCSDERGLDTLQTHDHLAIAHKGGILALIPEL